MILSRGNGVKYQVVGFGQQYQTIWDGLFFLTPQATHVCDLMMKDNGRRAVGGGEGRAEAMLGV